LCKGLQKVTVKDKWCDMATQTGLLLQHTRPSEAPAMESWQR